MENNIELTINYLHSRKNNPTYSQDDFLGFYHENAVEDASIKYLEKRGCELVGMSLDEILHTGKNFLLDVMHPDDLERCISLLSDYVNANQSYPLTYFQRLKFAHETDYKLYVTCVVLNEDKTLFKCVTSEVTQMKLFNSLVEKALNKTKYIEKYAFFYEQLTTREKEILALVCKGKSAKEIGESLFLSHHTVEKHKKNIKAKIPFESKSQMIQFSLNFDII